ncbi:hypothetical protein NE237_005273 [Protea cynaroides]|uniref:VQ domain-containing protein n=1 Tax=Protea cynaroides TaxID=273540 RepID=A0A9Q0KL13_9MAGN|nr:hypothetical protein NE237_005273 [Protea cynaroides]
MSSSGENHKRVSTRRELCGPRPRSLNTGVLGIDSSKIKKPAADQSRRTVVIHLRSPEIIHTRPQDFRALVQQLTGKASSSSNAQKCGSISTAAVIDDCKCKACEISSTGDSIQNKVVEIRDSIQNGEVEIFSNRDSVRDPQDNEVKVTSSPLFAPMVPPSWPASPPSMFATSFQPASPYGEWHVFGQML